MRCEQHRSVFSHHSSNANTSEYPSSCIYYFPCQLFTQNIHSVKFISAAATDKLKNSTVDVQILLGRLVLWITKHELLHLGHILGT